ATVPQIIEGVCDTIAGEIQRSLDFFLATSGEPEMHRIFVTGGSSALPALGNAIARRRRVPVEGLQPTARIAIEGKEVDQQTLQAHAAQLTVALGLGLRTERERREGESTVIRVNLLPQKKAGRVAKPAGASQTWVVVVLSMLVVEIIAFFGI